MVAEVKTRATAAEWAERVRAWRASGQSARQFAQATGYSSKMLVWWSSALARRERRQPRVALARVVRVVVPAAPLVVSVGPARIEVQAGFDRALLRDVVDALGGGR